MHTPLPPERGVEVESPPPAPKPKLLAEALRTGSTEQVLQALAEDEMCAYTPLCITTGVGLEPPLVAAVRCGCSTHVLETLLAARADVNHTGANGLTPMLALVSRPTAAQAMAPMSNVVAHHWAGMQLPEEWFLEVARIFLRRGARESQVDGCGQKLDSLARRSGRFRLARLLEHWQGWQACQLLSAIWRRTITSPVLDLAHLPDAVQDLVCRFVAPINGELR